MSKEIAQKDFECIMTAVDAPRARRFGRLRVPMRLYWQPAAARAMGEMRLVHVEYRRDEDEMVLTGYSGHFRDLAPTDAVPEYGAEYKKATGQIVFWEAAG